ncbi:MAG: hypothetical protein R2706_12675 [Acidimicrobiales bacterium]
MSVLLPAPFFTEQGVHLTGVDVEVDAVIRQYTGKALGYASHGKHWFWHHQPRSSTWVRLSAF